MKVIFENDCDSVVKSVNENESTIYLPNHGFIVDIKSKFTSISFWFCKYVHII